MSLFRPQFWKIPEISDAERRRLPELAAALERRLQDIAARYPQAVFASSLAVEDMVITDAVCRLKLPIRIITLNTGKLNPETAALIAETNARYQTDWKCFIPTDKPPPNLKRSLVQPRCMTASSCAAVVAISAKSNRSIVLCTTRLHG